MVDEVLELLGISDFFRDRFDLPKFKKEWQTLRLEDGFCSQ